MERQIVREMRREKLSLLGRGKQLGGVFIMSTGQIEVIRIEEEDCKNSFLFFFF